jgi:putative phosphoribosyl transferase
MEAPVMAAYERYQEPYRDRRHAGAELAVRLQHLKGRNDVVVLALPRGGVPVGYEVARAIGAPLDVFLVRKLGLPGHRELAMGAIASGGVRVLNDEVVGWYRIPESVIDAVAKEEQVELERREREYRDGRQSVPLKGQTARAPEYFAAVGQWYRDLSQTTDKEVRDLLHQAPAFAGKTS